MWKQGSSDAQASQDVKAQNEGDKAIFGYLLHHARGVAGHKGCLVSLISFSLNHIDVLIEDVSDGNRWQLTSFYDILEEAHVASLGIYYVDFLIGTLIQGFLLDLGFLGYWYTWEHGRFSHTNIREHLDQGLATIIWRYMFLNSTILHHVHSISDYCVHSFRFEAIWVYEDSYEVEVQCPWTDLEGDIL
ncbi:hypothetical protein Goarm_005319 [Gossypium armourianum]|uniref:Uncharacterized protein n=1 Tax=Gossypium armourianum TaxID=34283 RepID=A0A7J9JZI3_9ROSI|nr:hypothetical protein [Gossypium armourianum]